MIYKRSIYLDEEKQRLFQRFLEVQNFAKEEFAAWKAEIADKFRSSCLKYLKIRAGSPIKENDLKKILQEEGLKLIVKKDEERHNLYSIVEKEKINES